MSDQSVDITSALDDIAAGKQEAWDLLIPAVYRELKKQAMISRRNERPDHTLQATELVHELLLRLIKRKNVQWENRGHFFKAAAIALNYLLVDHARHRNRLKGPGRHVLVPLTEAEEHAEPNAYLQNIEVLDVVLKRFEAGRSRKRKCQVVNMHFFMGLTFKEIADELGISLSTVKSEWRYSKAWLLREIKKIEGTNG